MPRAACDVLCARCDVLRATVVVVLLAASGGCEREARRYRELPAAASRPESVQLTQLQPGAPQPAGRFVGPYEENAYGIGEGKRLFTAFNCNGCHAQGGGGIGPALMDANWIYGSEPDQVYSTISQGRPNGMPAFGPKVPSQQIWQLVAYSRSLSMLVPRDAAPSRNDDMNAHKPELRLERLAPRQTGHR